MTLSVLIGFNPEALSAIAELTAAIRSIGGSAPATKTATTTSAASTPKDTTPKEDAPVSIKWVDNTRNECGIAEDEAEFKALKKSFPKIVKSTDATYEKMLAVKAAEASEDDEKLPTEDDVLEAFSGYLPKDLDKAERTTRVAFVKPLLARFGADKASNLPEEHRKLAINLVLRKAAGQDIDPETDEFEEFESEEGLI